MPEQVVAPGAHTPVQAPLWQAWFVHGAGALHVPSLAHVSTPFPEHWVDPGAHTPMHAPFEHAEFVHGIPASHVPLLAQV
jgi:hypothetical protein